MLQIYAAEFEAAFKIRPLYSRHFQLLTAALIRAKTEQLASERGGEAADVGAIEDPAEYFLGHSKLTPIKKARFAQEEEAKEPG